ncbi:MAG: hypothetical protein KF755_08700 [Burkholderiaceae bacterium]|nr:hypothetical protein [Burkholderiaceae bacterium]
MSNLQSEPAAPAGERDESVSLADLWRVLVDRRWLIVATFAVVVSAGLGYAFLKAPDYEASARIRVGQVAGTGLIETVEVLSSRLMVKYGEIVATGVKRPRPFLARAASPRGVTGVIDLVVEGDTPDDAVALLERIYADIKAVHDDAYRRGVALLDDAVRGIDQRRATLQKQFDESAALVQRLRENDVTQASLVMLERSRIAALITELDAEKPKIAQKLLLPQTAPTELVEPIAAPVCPSAPRKVLIGALSVVLGLIAGVMLALFADSLAKSRR